MELLSRYINDDKTIEGIQIGETEIKQSLFADNATYLTNGKQKSFERLIEVITEYSKISGLRLNIQKSVVLKVGSLRNKQIKYSKNKEFIWTSEYAKTLGIIFHTNTSLAYELNLKPKIIDFQNCFKQWQHRKLTLMGKIIVVKTFALSKLVYPFTVLPNPPDSVIKDINKAIYSFILYNKPDKIKRNIITKGYNMGGLKLTDVESFLYSIKSCWVKRLTSTQNKGNWKLFYDRILNNLGKEIIFNCNLNSKIIDQIIKDNVFLKDVLKYWCSINNCYITEKKIGISHII